MGKLLGEWKIQLQPKQLSGLSTRRYHCLVEPTEFNSFGSSVFSFSRRLGDFNTTIETRVGAGMPACFCTAKIPTSKAIRPQFHKKKTVGAGLLHTPKCLLVLTFSLGVFFRALLRSSGFGV